MKNARGRVLAVGLFSSATAASITVEAEPLVLTESQMDRVTAGAVFASVEPFAAARGEDFARAATDVQTNAVTTALFELAFGIGEGQALACCGPSAEAVAGTSVAGGGDVVVAGEFTAEHDNDLLAIAYTVGWVVAYSRPSAGALLPHADGFLQQYADRVVEEITHGVAEHAGGLAVGAESGPSS